MKKNKILSLIFISIVTISFVTINIIHFFPTSDWDERLNPEIDKKVGCFYYTWWGNSTNYSQTVPYVIEDNEAWYHWNDPSSESYVFPSENTPELGLYDSSDPETIEKHLRDAEWAGIDYFIVSFWGFGFEYRAFETVLNVAKSINSNISFCFYFEILQDGIGHAPDDEAATKMIDKFRDIYTVVTDPINIDYFLFEDEKPVLFCYVSWEVNANVWTNVTTTLKTEGIEFLINADEPEFTKEANMNFGAIHYYIGREVDLKAYQYNDAMKRSAKKNDQILTLTVCPGYNDTAIRDGVPVFKRENGERYKQTWERAISFNPDWIVITSWNEWHEGTEIEPSVENGDLALNQTKAFIQEFKSGNYETLVPKEVTHLLRFQIFLYTVNVTYGIHIWLSTALAWVIVILFVFSKKLQSLSIKLERLPRALRFLIHLLPWAALGYIFFTLFNFQIFKVVANKFWIYAIPLLLSIQNIIPLEKREDHT